MKTNISRQLQHDQADECSYNVFDGASWQYFPCPFLHCFQFHFLETNDLCLHIIICHLKVEYKYNGIIISVFNSKQCGFVQKSKLIPQTQI